MMNALKASRILYSFLGAAVVYKECERLAAAIVARKTYRFGYIYFIQNKATGYIKIGISISPNVRTKRIQDGTGSSMHLLAFAYASHAVEKALHAKFKQYHVHGEWFQSAPEITNLAAALGKVAGVVPIYAIHGDGVTQEDMATIRNDWKDGFKNDPPFPSLCNCRTCGRPY